MASSVDLAAIVAAWRRSPDPTQINAALRASVHRVALAMSIYGYTEEMGLSRELSELVVDCCLEDPLLNEIVDVLAEHAVADGERPPARLIDSVVARVEARPDREGFVTVLVDSLLDVLGESDEEPPTVVSRFVDLAVRVADRLGDPVFAPLYLLRHRLQESPDHSLEDLRRCRILAHELPIADRIDLLTDVAVEAAVRDDAELAGTAAAEGLELVPHAPEDIDRLALLLTLRAAAAPTHDPELIDELTRALTADPRLAGRPDVTEEWFRHTVGYAATLAMSNASLRVVRPYVDLLTTHAAWWPQDEQWCWGLVVVTRFLVASRDFEQAQSWLSTRWPPGAGDPDTDMDAELAMLRLHCAFHLGRLDDAARLVREAAAAVRLSTLDEHRLGWAALARNIAYAGHDLETRAELEALFGSLVDGMSDQAAGQMGHSKAALIAQEQFYREVTRLTDVASTGSSVVSDLVAAQALLENIPSESPQLEAGALVVAATLEALHGDLAVAGGHVARIRSIVAEQRVAPLGALNLEAMELMTEMWSGVNVLRSSGSTEHVAHRWRIRRDQLRASGQHTLAHILTLGLIILSERSSDHRAVLSDGISGLAQAIRQVGEAPDARERAGLRQDVLSVADACFKAAVAVGDPHLAAEILEVLRAQPTPTSAPAVTDTERSISVLAQRLVGDSLPSHTGLSIPWADAAAGGPGVALTGDEEDIALLLGTLPSIWMPWGPALNDTWRSTDTAAVVRVLVHRGDIPP